MGDHPFHRFSRSLCVFGRVFLVFDPRRFVSSIRFILLGVCRPHPFRRGDTIGTVVGLIPQFVFPSVGFKDGVDRAWLVLGKRA